MTTALIGHTGFVGGALSRQYRFDALFNSGNFREMAGQSFDLVACAGLPATKWKINKDPKADWINVLSLQSVLERVTTNKFVLISTIDVYPNHTGQNEDASFPSLSDMNAYGYHRLQFEHFVANRFPDASIVRLPGLFGTGLKKNIIFDLLNDNRLEAISPDSVFQWYPVERLWNDLTTIREAGLSLCNLFPEPIATSRILSGLFPHKQVGKKAGTPDTYDMRTKHGALFGCSLPGYMATADAIYARLEEYVRTETAVLKKVG